MPVWLQNDLGTMITAGILILAVILALRKIIKDKKEGRHSCGGGCEGCPHRGKCH